MKCPYNGFVSMDCSECAAWIMLCHLVEHGTCDHVCAIAFHGGAVQTRPILMMPEVKQSNEWR